MTYENLTIKAQEALNEASSLAQKNDNAQIESEHLLLALLSQADGVVPPLLERVGVKAASLAQECRSLIAAPPQAGRTIK
jgi:ATP-dependent Clp protease ATP-binding subunit ClpB